jgi:PIN domain nuclease of toxin-antitoxin system
LLLLDTQVLIWIATGSSKVGPKAQRRLSKGAHVSAITFWEMEMLVIAKRIRMDLSVSEVRQAVLASNVTEVPVDGVISMTAAKLGMHGDPGDRFIVATALTHGATLMTSDAKISAIQSLTTIDPRD